MFVADVENKNPQQAAVQYCSAPSAVCQYGSIICRVQRQSHRCLSRRSWMDTPVGPPVRRDCEQGRLPLSIYHIDSHVTRVSPYPGANMGPKVQNGRVVWLATAAIGR